MTKIQKLLVFIATNKGFSVIVVIAIAFTCYTIVDKITLPNQAGSAVTENTIDAYDEIFSRQKLVSVSDGPYKRTNDMVMEVVYQLTEQDVQRLLEAKHILMCKDTTSCKVEDIAPVSSSLGDYKTTAVSGNLTLDVYIDSSTKKADWIFRSY